MITGLADCRAIVACGALLAQWTRRIVTVGSAQRHLLDDTTGMVSGEDVHSACGMIKAFGDGSGTISIMRVLAACAVNAEIGSDWISSKKEMPPDVFSAQWAEEEANRAALLFRVLEARRGVPTDRATLVQSLDEIGVAEPYRGAVPASLVSDDSVSHEQQDSTALAIKDFTSQPVVVTVSAKWVSPPPPLL
jgi:hypothetical protein